MKTYASSPGPRPRTVIPRTPLPQTLLHHRTAAVLPSPATAAKREDWQSQLTLESMGEVGKLSPVIDSILSQENGQADVYIPGPLIVINGDNLRFDKTDTQQGVFVRSGDNPEVRLTTYGTITPDSLSVLMPGTLTGPQTVRVVAFINGSVRSFTYMTPVAQSA